MPELPTTSVTVATAGREPWSALQSKSNFVSRAMVLDICVKLAVRVPGNIVEFGVAQGDSTRAIKRALRRHGSALFSRHGKKELFALDSFEGLRESFENAKVGEFAGSIPNIAGVNFVKGYFEQTCTPELKRRVGQIAFAHLDADLYSSTLFALRWMTGSLDTGSLLLFDEFEGGERAEARACAEWQAEKGTKLLRIAEFDRDPSGYGTQIDKRVLFQVIGDASIERPDRGSIQWRIVYYLNRCGMHNAAEWLSQKT